MSYVKLFLYLALLAAGAYYYFQHRAKTPDPTVAQTEDLAGFATPTPPSVVLVASPSATLRPVMTTVLPKLLAPLSEGPYELDQDVLALESKIYQASAGQSLNSPWKPAQRLYQEIKRIARERNSAIEAFKRDEATVDAGLKKNVASTQMQELQARKEFFLRNKQKTWEAKLPQMRSNLQMHYEQILALEKPAP